MTSVELATGFLASYPERLQVLATVINQSSLSPHGVHLRWYGPKVLARPVSCEIYRFGNQDWLQILKDKAKTLENLQSGAGDVNWAGSNRQWKVDNKVLLVAPVNNPQQCLLRFAEPLSALQIRFTQQGARPRVRGFHRNHLLFDEPAGSTTWLEGAGITDVLIETTPQSVRQLIIVSEAAVVAHISESHSLSPLSTVNIPTSAQQAYALVQPEIDRHLHNHFIDTDSLNGFKSRYAVREVERLVSALDQHRNSAKPVAEVDSQHAMTPTDVDIAAFLHLATLDANVARLAGCYFTDLEASVEKSWRYMLLGKMAKDEPKYLAGYARVRGPSSLPVLNDKASAAQLPGISYRDRKPQGDVGITLHHTPVANDPGTPVMLDVQRNSGNQSQLLTEKRPALIRPANEICLTDRHLPINSKVFYELVPIDLFARSGDAIKTNELTVMDLAAPVPPTELSFQVKQNGFPWTDPATLQPGYAQNEGTLSGRFRYAEGATTLSPDARKVQVRWWQGETSSRPTDIDAWNLLTELDLRKPLSTHCTLDQQNSLATVQLPIASVLAFDAAETQAPLTPDPQSNADIGAEPARRELLLNRALLEPNLFSGYRCIYANQSMSVMSSAAGIAYDDDTTEDKRLTARLTVAAGPALPNAGQAQLSLPALTSMSVQSLHAALRLSIPETLDEHSLIAQIGTTDAVDGLPAGGELAIDTRFQLKSTAVGNQWQPVLTGAQDGVDTVIGRLIAESIDAADSVHKASTLVRLRPMDIIKLLLCERLAPGKRPLRVHAPYVLGPYKVAIGYDADVRIDLAAGARFATLSLSAVALDAGGKVGPMSPVAEQRVVRPPPAPPAPPWPRDADSQATQGYASRPDQQRRSRVALSWTQNDQTLRYEVSRALDTSLVAQDRTLWWQGGSAHQAIESTPLPITVTDVEVLANGLLRVDLTLTGSTTTEAVAAARGGRLALVHSTSTGNITRFHRVMSIKRSSSQHYLLCRAHQQIDQLGTVATPLGATLTAPPDYSGTLADNTALRTLADLRDAQGRPLLDAAFGVVTGAPLTPTLAAAFHDTVPGPGNSRFFYRVRAVASSGAASAWSAPSVAFHQFAPHPNPLSGVSIERLASQWLISWERTVESATRVVVSRRRSNGMLEELNTVTSDRIIAAPRYAPSSTILFNEPIYIVTAAPSSHSTGGDSTSATSSPIATLALPDTLSVAIEGTGIALPGLFIARIEADDQGTYKHRLAGFQVAGEMPLTGSLLVRNGTEVLQTLSLSRSDRHALLLTDALVSNTVQQDTIRLELQSETMHNGIPLRSHSVEVHIDA